MYLYLPEGGDTWRDVETFNEARGNEILTGNFDIVFERKKDKHGGGRDRCGGGSEGGWRRRRW